jgi:hypothetical protein
MHRRATGTNPLLYTPRVADYSPAVASEFDQSDFVDSDFQAAKASGFGGGAATGTARPPSREEIESKVNETHQRLQDLKRQQEELERERAALEEARRRRTEFHLGRDEMLQHLTRGIGLLEEAEFDARRDAEQMAKTLGELRDAMVKIQTLNDHAWTQDNYNVELTRALTAIENARMEWNAAQLKWPVLSGSAAAGTKADPEAPVTPMALTALSFGQLARLGLAFTWPLALIALAAGVVSLILVLNR